MLRHCFWSAVSFRADCDVRIQMEKIHELKTRRGSGEQCGSRGPVRRHRWLGSTRRSFARALCQSRQGTHYCRLTFIRGNKNHAFGIEMLGTILLIILILILVGALPTWPYSASWGY